MAASLSADGHGRDFDAIVVGAGFSGMYMLHRLRRQGLATCVLEAGSDVGGTWYWNRYPGARCDVESLSYSYSFDDALQQEWVWKERYAPQPEILDYARHVADRFDLRRDIRFDTRVTAARYDETANLWTVETEAGDRFSATYCIMATGVLSVPRKPDLPGLETFEGDWFHTGLWPHEGVDFAGKRVGVIGTGSSAIQSIPVIAGVAAHVTVLQRTAHYSVPDWNGPLDPEVQRAYKANYAEHRARMRASESGILYDTHDINRKSAAEVPADARQEQFEIRWKQGGFNFQNTFPDVTSNQESNDLYAEFARAKIRDMVDDPAIAEKLCPTDFPICTKRLCVDTNYFATYNRDNVTLVDLKEQPIREVTPKGLRAGEHHHDLDIIVFATGFDAVTGALLRIDITGRDGYILKDDWADGPRSYLGLAMAGYPNLFTITGPGSPSVFTNMFVSIELHVEWIADCIRHMREHSIEAVEATEQAQDDWADHVRELGEKTLYPKANSWYMGANIPGKPRIFLAYVAGHRSYAEACHAVAVNAYDGFTKRRMAEAEAAV